MAPRNGTFADLEPDQLALVAEAERTLDADVVMAYKPSAWGTVDPRRRSPTGCDPVELEPSQLECLQGLERMVGGVLVAYRRESTDRRLTAATPGPRRPTRAAPGRRPSTPTGSSPRRTR